MAGVYLALAIIAEQLWYDDYSWLLIGKVLLDFKKCFCTEDIYLNKMKFYLKKNIEGTASHMFSLTHVCLMYLQLLIENAPRLCRLPNNVALALEHREQSRSTENLLTPSEPHPATRKKRRSASIHSMLYKRILIRI